jgi:lipoprotein LpqH
VALTTVVAGLTGCSSNNTSTSTGTSSSASASALPPGGSKVVIDGQTQTVSGQVTCTPAGGNVNIGIGDATNGIGAAVTTADPPVVQAVGLGNLTGATLGYSSGAPNKASAQATKSCNSYTITGTATGTAAANPQQALSKSFEMDVTCP